MSHHKQDLYQLNLAYLHSARELARRDPQEAKLKFGLSSDVLEALIKADVVDIQKIASSSFMLFQPRGKQSQLLEMVKSKGTGIPRIAYLLSTLNNKDK
ncbi:flagellar transcriptional regulator FlhD [Vibrio vulnificus]|uniref:flagellar transcriptional regulator FlhD n=1 Tax=Vibrio vulnificus TaxID=672 RepID=UPI00063DB89F|nr:flagellar transcriptional regulator FlhD [Vibrio vulnificus]EGR7942925.1 transcriptional regulator [Vibrio vulnificus]EHV9837994.1 flagellar transcriptional regulator FlhD [Vibrio vulnificus]EIV8493988.1 flagellar transcriptional regulator FlhD [Vibrio vulnificus]ELH4809186.1 flagellar transcriptional regulator FlhD [Vibrio vulnificus]ELV8670178.1 flagellar transcriptional regulator FlhD [Vibrio vulnificus]